MRITVLLAALLVLCQCAKKDSDNFQEMADRSFDALMARDFPDAAKLESGMYIEWLRDVPGPTIVKDDWLMLDYRGETLGGQVFSTRDEDEAFHEATHTWRTRYTPHYMAYDDTFVLSPGEKEALALMSAGDSVRLYIPTKLGYRYSYYLFDFQYGYEGWFNTPANPNAASKNNISAVPVIVELSLKEIVKDPKTREFNDMQAKLDELGFTAADRVTDSLYFYYTEIPQTEDYVGEDSTFYISYTGRFLDGFVLKTNDPVVGVDELRDIHSSFMPLSYKASSPPSALSEEAIREVIRRKKVLYDSQFRIIFTSIWGYGTAGQPATSSSPVVYPYTPLYFDIKVQPWGYDPDADE